jgi:hypothetical protein
MDKTELLTTDEITHIKMLADLVGWFSETIPKDMINGNLTPFIVGINHLQTLIMSRAAQRSFPEVFSVDTNFSGPSRD